MELKFAATIDLSQQDIARLVEEEVARRHKNVKVTKIDFNVYMTRHHAGLQIGGGCHEAPHGVLGGAKVTVERTEA